MNSHFRDMIKEKKRKNELHNLMKDSSRISRREFLIKLGVGSTAAYLSYACKRPEKKKIEKFMEDGVEVVKNPSKPVYGKFLFDLEKDLSIGREDDKNYMFYRVRGIGIDGQENIYVLDSGNYRIQKFDKEGQYIQTIGRKGQGPGEFEMPLRFCLDIQDNIYVNEYRKLEIFNNKGEFVKSIPLETSIGDFAIDCEGNILANARFRRRDIIKSVIVKMNSKGKIVKKIAEFSVFGPKIIITSNGTWTLYPNREYRPRLLFAPLDEGSFIYGFSSEYQIIKIDKNGNPLLKIRKEESPHSISRRERKFIVEKHQEIATQRGMKVSKKIVEEASHFRKYRPYFNKFIIDEKQRLYVQKIKSVLDESEQIDFDIFNGDGNYTYKANIPFSPEIIRNGYLYDLYTSEGTGEVKVNRYKVKNWDQIKF